MIRIIGIGLLLCSCSTPTPWTVNHIHSDQESFCFTKLSYHSPDRVNGIDVDFVHNDDHIQAYLTVHSIPVPSLKEDPHAAAVVIQSTQEKLHCVAYRFQGGQRLQIPLESSKKIIEWLQSKQEITILLRGYRTVLKPEDFERKYETFLHPFPLRNPFQFSL